MKVGYADDATQCLQPKQVARAFVICQYMCKYIIPQSRRRIGVAVTRLRGCNADRLSVWNGTRMRQGQKATRRSSVSSYMGSALIKWDTTRGSGGRTGSEEKETDLELMLASIALTTSSVQCQAGCSEL